MRRSDGIGPGSGRATGTEVSAARSLREDKVRERLRLCCCCWGHAESCYAALAAPPYRLGVKRSELAKAFKVSLAQTFQF